MDARPPFNRRTGMAEGLSFRIYLAGGSILVCHSQTSPTKVMWVQALLGIQEKHGYTKYTAMAG